MLLRLGLIKLATLVYLLLIFLLLHNLGLNYFSYITLNVIFESVQQLANLRFSVTFYLLIIIQRCVLF